MTNCDSSLPLFVDLDGTLIKSDMTLESALLLIKRNFLYLLLIPFWFLRGRPYLKQQLAQRTNVPLDYLPVNEEFFHFLKQEKIKGRPITLISASNQEVVSQVSDHFQLFDNAFGSNDRINLKAENKLKRIREMHTEAFSYAGNSSADLPIWIEAQEAVMVNCNESLVQRLRRNTTAILRFDNAMPFPLKLWQAMRPHQWLKNLLLFVPLVLAHRINDPTLLLQTTIGFLSFSLCASSVYLLNDMLDLNSDRQHHSKHRRPFASGELSLPVGCVAVPVLLLSAFAVGSLLPRNFVETLFLYWIVTSFYSFFLKRLFLIDVITLAILYTMRIAAGAAAVSITITSFLIAFSLFLFLGLGLVKRVTELVNLEKSDKGEAEGRAYSKNHIGPLTIIGGSSNLFAVLVFAFYAAAPDTTRLYSSPPILWLICPLLLCLLIRIWKQAREGKLDEDPVLFAITDRVSQLITVLSGLLLWLAT